MSFDLRFTHAGFFVRDVERMAAYYKDTLGFFETDRGFLEDRQLIFLSRDPDEHHQIIFIAGLSKKPVEEVINQLSFRFVSLHELLAFAKFLRGRNPEDMQPINHGNAWSIYFRDPEGNRIEAYTPSTWYISQPCRVPLDIDRAEAAIRATTEEWCRVQPGFMPAETYRAQLAARMSAARSGD
jgi:catechol 2,3-dioxygenase